MLPFCASVYQLIDTWNLVKESGEESPAAAPNGKQVCVCVCIVYLLFSIGDEEEKISTVTLLQSQLIVILITYWILVVVGAFLLVIVAGDASILKSVYVVFFFILLLFYQVSVIRLYACTRAYVSLIYRYFLNGGFISCFHFGVY